MYKLGEEIEGVIVVLSTVVRNLLPVGFTSAAQFPTFDLGHPDIPTEVQSSRWLRHDGQEMLIQQLTSQCF